MIINTTLKEVSNIGDEYTLFDAFSGAYIAGPMSGAEAVEEFGEYVYRGRYTTGFTTDGFTADVWVRPV